MARKKPQKSPKFSKNQLLLGALLVGLLLAIAYLLAYVPYSIQKDKQRFLDAKPYLETVKTQIENTIGQADEVTYEEGCSKASRKYVDGPLSCSIDYEIIYNSTDAKTSTATANNIAGLFNSQVQHGMHPIDKMEFEENYKGNWQDFRQQLDRINGLDCILTYRFVSRSSDGEKNVASTFYIFLHCGDTAKREHF